MPTTNIFAAVLGIEKIKWDATWNVLSWLLDPNEGHGLGSRITSRLSEHIFGIPAAAVEPRNEHNLGNDPEGKSKWADLTLCFPSSKAPVSVAVLDDIDVRSPGSMRKLRNLQAYGALARKAHPRADVRIIAITNAVRAPSIAKVRSIASRELGPESEAAAGDATRWHLLSLGTVGEWVASELPAANSNPKVRGVLEDFCAWTRELE